MKLRSCFITNSSSTSFVMIGWAVDFPDVYSRQKELVSKVFGVDLEKLSDEETEDLFYELRHLGYNGLSFQIGEEHGAPDDDTILVGMRVSLMNDELIEYREEKFSIKELKEVLNIARDKFNIKKRPKILTSWFNT